MLWAFAHHVVCFCVLLRLVGWSFKAGFHIVVSVVSVVSVVPKKFIGEIQLYGNLPYKCLIQKKWQIQLFVRDRMNSICPMNFFRTTDTTDTTIWKPGFDQFQTSSNNFQQVATTHRQHGVQTLATCVASCLANNVASVCTGLNTSWLVTRSSCTNSMHFRLDCGTIQHSLRTYHRRCTVIVLSIECKHLTSWHPRWCILQNKGMAVLLECHETLRKSNSSVVTETMTSLISTPFRKNQIF